MSRLTVAQGKPAADSPNLQHHLSPYATGLDSAMRVRCFLKGECGCDGNLEFRDLHRAVEFRPLHLLIPEQRVIRNQVQSGTRLRHRLHTVWISHLSALAQSAQTFLQRITARE